jgi:hypothetical protein
MEGHITASPSTLREPDLGNAARLRLNVDARLMPVDRRSPEDLCVWYRPPARSRSAPHVPLADAIVAHLGMACDATDVTLRLDGYAVASADVLRDGDVVHVCARDWSLNDAEHGGPWPVSPAAASLRYRRPSGGIRDAPATAPPGHRPYAALPAGERRARKSETSAEDGDARGGVDADAKRQKAFSDSGMPETKTCFTKTRGDAPPERSRSARRKALKRARKREASFGATRELELAGNGDADRDHPAADAGRFFVESKPERRASEKHFFLKALCLPANGALDPNGDLARHGGALAGWPEEKWVPHPSEDALRAAEASLSLAASAARKEHDFFSKNADANRPAPTTTTPGAQNARKIVFSDDDDDDDASDSSDAASDSEDEDATGADSDEDHSIETERAPPSAPLDPPRYDVRSDENVRRGVPRAMLESLVAADHTLANQSLPIPGAFDPDDTGASLLPGDVVRYRYRVPDRALSRTFACSYFQGEVVSVAPDFGDAGGVRLAVTIAPWPERRRTEALVCAARAAAEAETEKRRDGDRTVDPTSSLPAPFDATCVATLGTRDVLEARLIGGPRYLVCKKPRHVAAGRGLDGEETAQAYAARGGVGGALAALRAGGSLEKR